MVEFQSNPTNWTRGADSETSEIIVKYLKAQEPEAYGLSTRPSLKICDSGVPVFGGRKRWMFQLMQRANLSFLCLFKHLLFKHLLCSKFEFTTNSNVISSRDILTYVPRSNVLPTLWASFSSVKLTHKITHYNNGTLISWHTYGIHCMYVLCNLLAYNTYIYERGELCH